ncbi:MAG: hypothetical protein WC615_00040 [Mucilaginibacter sp.]|jgi:hypothetical protein|uniref:hypothetical protein n=1 Tax=Mucilaginibacter sp. TaxID=1882438 RepID=UPI003565D774
MEINKDNLAFRKVLAKEYVTLKSILEKYQIDSKPIDKAITELKDEKFLPGTEDWEPDPLNWGYSVRNMVFEESTSSVQYPKNIKRLKITFGITCVSVFNGDSTQILDPFKHLEFNIVAEGFNKTTVRHVVSFHLDRHLDVGNKPDEAHPIYHFQFGGRKLKEAEEQNFGSSLILDSPRMMHYPMDLIMGIDFLTSNFAPAKWSKLRKDRDFIILLNKAQQRIMKPWVHSLANHFKLNSDGNFNFDPKVICPQLA